MLAPGGKVIGTRNREAVMSALPPNAKPPPASNPLSIPSSWAGPLADSAATDWMDAYPVAQGGKGKPGPKGRLLLVSEVAEIVRCTDATVCRHLRAGSLIGHRVGGRWRVYEADLDAFLFAEASGPPGATSLGAYPKLLDLSPVNGPAAASSGAAAQLPYFLAPTQVK
jgi:excisionase family DNA binding protein